MNALMRLTTGIILSMGPMAIANDLLLDTSWKLKKIVTCDTAVSSDQTICAGKPTVINVPLAAKATIHFFANGTEFEFDGSLGCRNRFVGSVLNLDQVQKRIQFEEFYYQGISCEDPVLHNLMVHYRNALADATFRQAGDMSYGIGLDPKTKKPTLSIKNAGVTPQPILIELQYTQ